VEASCEDPLMYRQRQHVLFYGLDVVVQHGQLTLSLSHAIVQKALHSAPNSNTFYRQILCKEGAL
jgi:hypothetical protein